jgi:hypothetical protein
MLMIVLIGLWGGAISYQSNAALMILALILGGALVSGVHAWNNLRGIKVHATAGAGAFALEALTGTMIMDGGQQERSQLTAHLLHGRTGSLKLMLKLGTMEWVPPGKSACMDFTVPPQVRGP